MSDKYLILWDVLTGSNNNYDSVQMYHSNKMHHHTRILCIIAVTVICVNGGFAKTHNTTGCPECQTGWCPKGEAQCPLGLVEDICECCPQGVCAKIEGEDCYNSTLVPKPSVQTKKYGTCGTNLNCIYKTDVVEWDIPHAICVCEDTRMVCSSHNVTYSSICDMNQEAAKNKDSPEKYFVQNYGPCIAIPVISVGPRDVVAYIKQIVVFSCEVRGYPIPTIAWEFTSQDNTRKKILPSDIPHIAIQSRGGPGDFMTTSWVQIIRVQSADAGVYTCVAKNDLGHTKASARVIIREIKEEI